MGIHFFSLLLLLLLLCSLSSALDYTDLVYKGCADQDFQQDPSGSYAKTLKTLFDSLISQSAKTNFSKTTATGDGGRDTIFGLYQCRGDLTGVDCSKCVSLFPKLARKLCGEAVAVRVQLVGCYMRYEIAGFRQVSSTELLYKYCKGTQVGDAGFDEKKESAFEEVESGVAGGNGFYAASYESVYAMGQCEGDLEGSECGDCVRTALERAKAECGEAISGQVYLNQCYISYTYYPNGVGDNSDEKAASSPGRKHNTAKTVAIVVGATAAVGFAVVVWLFTKSVLKKKSTTPKYYYEYGG